MDSNTQQDVALIDNVINIESHRVISRHLHAMTLHGVELPNSNEMDEYIFSKRLEKSVHKFSRIEFLEIFYFFADPDIV